MTRQLLLPALLVAASFLAGERVAAARQLKAVATFTVLADMVHQVGRDRVHVQTLVGPNGDPHAFEPTPDDARKLKAADIVFMNGLGLEGWMDRLITASGFRGKPVVASAGIEVLRMVEDDKQVADPHAWNSAANGSIYVHNIVVALSAVDPEGTATYKVNGDQYDAKLKNLDAYTRQQLKAIPVAGRKILTTHEAFGYFGHAYGVSFLAPLGVSTETEPSAKDVAALIRQIKAEHVRAYFFESSSDPRLLEQIANATGAQPGGILYVEALSEPDGPAATYTAMFRYNVDKLVAAMRAGTRYPSCAPNPCSSSRGRRCTAASSW